MSIYDLYHAIPARSVCSGTLTLPYEKEAGEETISIFMILEEDWKAGAVVLYSVGYLATARHCIPGLFAVWYCGTYLGYTCSKQARKQGSHSHLPRTQKKYRFRFETCLRIIDTLATRMP